MFQVLKHMYQGLVYKFQALEYKFLPWGKTFSPKVGKKAS